MKDTYFHKWTSEHWIIEEALDHTNLIANIAFGFLICMYQEEELLCNYIFHEEVAVQESRTAIAALLF